MRGLLYIIWNWRTRSEVTITTNYELPSLTLNYYDLLWFMILRTIMIRYNNNNYYFTNYYLWYISIWRLDLWKTWLLCDFYILKNLKLLNYTLTHYIMIISNWQSKGLIRKLTKLKLKERRIKWTMNWNN